MYPALAPNSSRLQGPGRVRSAFRHGFVVAACFGLTLLVACSSPREAAPVVQYTLLSGEKLGSEALKGRVSLVNFWATTCVSCVKEMPDLVKLHERFAPRGYETVAVAMSYDAPDFVVNFANTRKLPFKVVLDHGGTLARAYPDVKVTPTSFLIDKQGRIAKRWVGEPDFVALGGTIEALLDEK